MFNKRGHRIGLTLGASIVNGVECSVPLLPGGVPYRELVLLGALATVRTWVIDSDCLIHVRRIEGTLLFVIKVVLAESDRD